MSVADNAWVNPPNLISLSRVLLIIPTAYGILAAHALLSVLGFGLIIISDILDGATARRLNIRNPHGTLIDHGADALTVVCLCSVFSHFALCPPILPALIALAFGQYALDATHTNGRRPRPSKLGKFNGVSYFLFCGACLVLELTKISLAQETFNALRLAIIIFAWSLIVSTLASIGQRALLYKP